MQQTALQSLNILMLHEVSASFEILSIYSAVQWKIDPKVK